MVKLVAQYTVEEIKQFKETGILSDAEANQLINAITASATSDIILLESETTPESVIFDKDVDILSYRNPLFSFVITQCNGYISSHNSRSCGFEISICGNNRVSRYLLRDKEISILTSYKSSGGYYDVADDSNIYMRESDYFEVDIDIDEHHRKGEDHPQNGMYAVHYFVDDGEDLFDDDCDFDECDFLGKPYVERLDSDTINEIIQNVDIMERHKATALFANQFICGNVIGYVDFQTQKMYINVIQNSSYDLLKKIDFASIYDNGNAVKYFELLELFDVLAKDVQGNISAIISILEQLIDIEPYTAIDRWNMLFPEAHYDMDFAFTTEEAMYNVTDLIASKLFRHDGMVEAENAFFMSGYTDMVYKVFSHSRRFSSYLVWAVDSQLKRGNALNAENLWHALTKHNKYITDDIKLQLLESMLNQLKFKRQYLTSNYALKGKLESECVNLVRKWINEVEDPIQVAKLTVELMRVC